LGNLLFKKITLFFFIHRKDKMREMSEMDTETKEECAKNRCGWKDNMKMCMPCHGSGGALYGLGFLGALVYYITTATSLIGGVLGVIKAILWPAFLVYGLLKFIGA
jgi:hypothetical protein